MSDDDDQTTSRPPRTESAVGATLLVTAVVTTLLMLLMAAASLKANAAPAANAVQASPPPPSSSTVNCTLVHQKSTKACLLGKTFGCNCRGKAFGCDPTAEHPRLVWTTNGCRGVFKLEDAAPLLCGTYQVNHQQCLLPAPSPPPMPYAELGAQLAKAKAEAQAKKAAEEKAKGELATAKVELASAKAKAATMEATRNGISARIKRLVDENAALRPVLNGALDDLESEPVQRPPSNNNQSLVPRQRRSWVPSVTNATNKH